MPEAIRPIHGSVLRSSLPVMSVIFALAAIPFAIALFVTRDSEHAALICGCILAAVISFPKLRQGKRFEITERGIEIDQGKLNIAWNQIDSCAYGSYKISPDTAAVFKNKPVTVYYGDQSIRLLVDLPESNSEFYSGLWKIILSGNTPDLTEPLASTYRVAMEKHGSDRVVAAGSVARPARLRISGRLIFSFTAFLALAIVGANIGRGGGAAVAMASTSGIILTLIVILFFVERQKRDRNHGGAIVLTPQQLALQIKNLKGSLKWKDLKDVALTPSATKPVRLRLRVEGADIILEDYFQLPLWLLCDRAQFFQTNYSHELREARLAPENAVAVEVEEVAEDYNPFRPPRT